jgi:Glycosyl hydrolases family 39
MSLMGRQKWYGVWLAVLLIAVLPHWLIQAQDHEGLYVDAAQDLGAISPYSYGTNHGPWAFVAFDLWEAAEASGLTMIRFPGGNWGDLNDLRPQNVDDLMTLCEMMNAEPYLHVRMRDGSPEKAAKLVRYANIENDYNIRYWSIGNEPNLFDEYDTERYNREWRAIAEAMLEVDPSIILIGPEVSQYPPTFSETPKDAAGRDWMTEFLKANGDLVDIVSIHRYPFPKDRTQSTPPGDLRQNPQEWDTIIPNLRSLIQEVTGQDLPIAVTEFNSHWSPAYGGEASPDTLLNAVWLADVLGRMIRQKVDIITQFTLQSPNSFGGWGIFGQTDVIRPSYYTYQMYKQFGTTLLEASSTEPQVSIFAAQREDGTLTLMMVNLSDSEKTLPLQVDNFIPTGDAEVWLFDAEHNAELIGSESLGDSVILPPTSVVLYVVPN